MTTTWAYLVARAKERQTWLGVANAIVAASLYPWPYCFIALALSGLQMAMPDAKQPA